MKSSFLLIGLIWSLYSNSQTQQYISYFTPPTNFSDYGYSEYGPDTVVNDNSNFIRSCTFYNGMSFYPAVAMYSKNNMWDLAAQPYAYSYDSLVFKFKIKAIGYAKNFRVRGEFLQNTGSFPYSLTRNYHTNDSVMVRFKVGFTTTLPFNWKVWLEKQDTTLNNFTLRLSDLDIKGYLHYNPTGVVESTNNENKILYNNEAIFFDEKWLNKKYWITDVAGRELFNGKVNSTTEKINLDNGLYILNTEHGSQKMIISKN